jgi:hypothetical protein
MTTVIDIPTDEVTEAASGRPEIEPLPDAPEDAVVALSTHRGSLTIRPDQKDLDPDQTAALLAIGIDPEGDEEVLPHLRPFIHMCQIRNLDPWAKEAYLIGRGKRGERTYTMQVSIDGFRKIAGDTHRFIRRVGWYWTGSDDGDHTWRFDPTTGIMRRIWWDEWPEVRGWPGAAKCIIEHYDESHNVVTTDAIAHWSMYAPLIPKWTWGQRKGEKVYVKDAAGNQVMVLTEMWAKGYHHMLAKCGEALVIRTAFPRQTSGIYTFEEMARADVEERNRKAAETASLRREAYRAAHPAAVTIQQHPEPDPAPTEEPHSPPPVEAPDKGDEPHSPPPLDEPAPPAPAEDAAATGEPTLLGEHVGDVVADLASRPEVTDADRREWVMAELTFQAETLGATLERFTSRYTAEKPLDKFTLDELAALRERNRRMVATRLRRSGREAEATSYVESEGITAPLAVLLGKEAP